MVLLPHFCKSTPAKPTPKIPLLRSQINQFCMVLVRPSSTNSASPVTLPEPCLCYHTPPLRPWALLQAVASQLSRGVGWGFMCRDAFVADAFAERWAG